MNRVVKAARDRRAKREEYRKSIQYAIAHAISASDRNELITLAGQQGVYV
jgi:hypothetical protein